MVKILAATASFALSMSARAQNAPIKNQPIVEKPKREYLATSYCFYDDKKYSEGVAKFVDSQVLICMVRHRISVSIEEEFESLMIWYRHSATRLEDRLS